MLIRRNVVLSEKGGMPDMRALGNVAFMTLICLIAACATQPDVPMEFNAAMIRLSGQVMTQLRGNLPIMQRVTTTVAGPSDQVHVVIDPFIDGDTGDVNQTSERIATIFTQTIGGNGYRVQPLSNESLHSARFIVVGTIRHENYSGMSRKLYRVYASVVDIASGDIMANAKVWVANAKLDDAPVTLYRDSPMYLKDRVVQRQLDAAQTSPGPGRATPYVRTLSAGTTTSDGAEALGRGDYQTATRLFSNSLSQTDGRTMKNYAGLYEAYYRSNQKEAAMQAFSDLFALGVENDNITIRFLFAVDSTEFRKNGDIIAQYDVWLRQIARYLAANDQCMTVVGHTSHTGTEQHNLALSARRAQRIRDILTSYSRAAGLRLDSIGRGFEENIVGSGTDDDQDAVDRRVEFRKRACGLA
jgi:outer membrane protein OmpA-like peptidoglycan-associated protein